ncbi:hypothetical protein [Brevundimonas sp.]|uniref:hypothetical protein n=1 Tax=Brevundimonas sp. TaxID=1871086 RepID=UPI002897F7C8|nr:hypothetical protein [Brevundimonas sp.]
MTTPLFTRVGDDGYRQLGATTAQPGHWAALLASVIDARRQPDLQLCRATFDFFRRPLATDSLITAPTEILKSSPQLEQLHASLVISGDHVAEATLLFLRHDVAADAVASPLQDEPGLANTADIESGLPVDVSVLPDAAATGLARCLLAFPPLCDGLDLTFYFTRPLIGRPVALKAESPADAMRLAARLIDTAGPFALANATPRSVDANHASFQSGPNR